jgi:hypothetical protein
MCRDRDPPEQGSPGITAARRRHLIAGGPRVRWLANEQRQHGPPTRRRTRSLGGTDRAPITASNFRGAPSPMSSPQTGGNTLSTRMLRGAVPVSYMIARKGRIQHQRSRKGARTIGVPQGRSGDGIINAASAMARSDTPAVLSAGGLHKCRHHEQCQDQKEPFCFLAHRGDGTS